MSYFHDLQQRLRQPGGPPYYFRIANIVVAVLMIVSAVIFFVWADFMRIMLGVYEIVFGVWMILFELTEMAWLTPYVQFMFTWRGRGLFYVFIGCLTLGYKTLGWVFGSIITAIGVLYIVLSFTSMKDESYVNSTVSGNTTTMYNSSGMYGSQKATAMGGHSMYNDTGGAQYGAQTTYSGPVSGMPYGSQNSFSGHPTSTQQYGDTQMTYTTRDSSEQQPHYQSQPGGHLTSPSQTYAPRTDHLHTPI
ncbi:hypothetical protein H4R99_003220 [Coemansia sp. RSA 1722]|nr:hypothetical protein LPJ57_004161 [Coemansia sp. RSA 486]KAJ2233602.1 hypothetical protein IWW45_004043 [Coemansia sp. RSA 485]KAJ2600746.1 hypothetical protein H4R99_003220 [Coemansia sp. RSA 1722]